MTELTAEQQLRQLRESRAKVERLKASIQLEMQEMAEQGELWSNRQCKAWAEYTDAIVAHKELYERLEI